MLPPSRSAPWDLHTITQLAINRIADIASAGAFLSCQVLLEGRPRLQAITGRPSFPRLLDHNAHRPAPLPPNPAPSPSTPHAHASLSCDLSRLLVCLPLHARYHVTRSWPLSPLPFCASLPFIPFFLFFGHHKVPKEIPIPNAGFSFVRLKYDLKSLKTRGYEVEHTQGKKRASRMALKRTFEPTKRVSVTNAIIFLLTSIPSFESHGIYYIPSEFPLNHRRTYRLWQCRR